ncbi:CotO family spore coat protein [Bacillus pumilus]|uniref:CotO family spore coat protein n=1 Tax=Bacillus pumilus TaxID=1408 RepID=UPI0011E95DF4|nr:CotO family spore coat protein [Bacillus pumilus]TYS31979.1 spore coat protein [Bacillus pumilus]TYS48094.1 spore coat protein [Bacillus pumilus]
MSNKGDENQKPLMYIVQPSYDDSMPAMQNIVRKRKKSEKRPESNESAKAKDTVEESKQEEPVAQEIEKKKEAEPPELQQEQDITQKSELRQESEVTQERKPQQEEEKPPEGVFHETKEEPRRKIVKKPLSQMSMDEKVDFLTSLPHNMPRALCLIEADGKTYRGIIMDRKEDIVVIRTAGGGNPIELAIGEISSIHPLGF